MTTIQEFIDEQQVTAEIVPAPTNPNMEGMVEGSYHFHATIKGSHGQMNTFYSVGPGIVEHWVTERRGKTARQEVATFGEQRRLSLAKQYRPAVADILDCLAGDAGCIENSPAFNDFCDDMGYDTDSRKAKRTHEVILEQSAKLRSILGAVPYAQLVEDIERL